MKRCRSRARPRLSGPSRAGFSLIEVILVMALTGTIMLMVSLLARRTFTTLRVLQEKSHTVQAATLGIERLGSELREAVAVISDGPTLAFKKVDPGAPYAQDYDGDPDPSVNPGDPDLTIAPETWRPTYPDAELGTVTYTSDASSFVLTRTASKGSLTMATQVADHVNIFLADQDPVVDGVGLGPNVFRITLSLTEQRRVIAFESIVVVPGLEERD